MGAQSAALLGWKSVPTKGQQQRARTAHVRVASLVLVTLVACSRSLHDWGFVGARAWPSTRRLAPALPLVQRGDGGQQVGFGKYRDLTFAELCENDPDYVLWLQKGSDPSPQAAALIQYADEVGLAQPQQPDDRDSALSHEEKLSMIGRQTVGFGKYTDLTIEKLYEQDYSYVAWLRSQDEPSQAAMTLIGYADDRDSALSHEQKLSMIGRQTVGFGKYTDLTIEKLYEEDYAYVQWLCTQEDPSDAARKIIDYAKWKEQPS